MTKRHFNVLVPHIDSLHATIKTMKNAHRSLATVVLLKHLHAIGHLLSGDTATKCFLSAPLRF
ncbi:hypothetical protein NTG1052_310028 [Candidatus Nitrotoga sp. 1052]|nr:hypothetical protein NTG1052_310028 [Candidatus Nitrotoga sp. 1052]